MFKIEIEIYIIVKCSDENTEKRIMNIYESHFDEYDSKINSWFIRAITNNQLKFNILKIEIEIDSNIKFPCKKHWKKDLSFRPFFWELINNS